MNWYCDKCKMVHKDNELCPVIKKQLKNEPELLSEVANFTTIAGEYGLITTNALDGVAKCVNKVAGTNLSYEGTHQFARDIQVFKRLSEEPFKRAGTFASPEAAKNYLDSVTEIAKSNPRAMTSFESKLTGYSQEVDWLRYKQSQLSSVWEKSSLLSNNAKGIDGTTVNRFTGKTISNTTVKASVNPISKNSTIVKNLERSVENGTVTDKDIVFGPKGMKDAVQNAGLKNPTIEKNSVEQIQESNQRLKNKIMNGQAVTAPTIQQVGQKMAQGAIVGAAVGVTVSSITNYVRYKNGEITEKEAFRDVSEDTIKSAVVGGAMAGITIFLPGGAIGLVAGMVIGVYLNSTTTNILDEIYGKGAYGAILNSSGYVYGMTMNLAECYKKIEQNNKETERNIKKAQMNQATINSNFELFEKMKGEL